MFFRQLFDCTSCTYTYVIASEKTQQAAIIDPVHAHVEHYLQRLNEWNLTLKYTLETHMHADHVTASGLLRQATGCQFAMGAETQVESIDLNLEDGMILSLTDINIQVLYTPGHTNDSYCFYVNDRIFTGDTLLIRRTGRTDFQHGDAGDQYDSLFNKVFALPPETLVYPAHDYEGMTVSTLGEERDYNPRLQVNSKTEYVELMNQLNLPKPKLIDIAVPANLTAGLNFETNA